MTFQITDANAGGVHLLIRKGLVRADGSRAELPICGRAVIGRHGELRGGQPTRDPI